MNIDSASLYFLKEHPKEAARVLEQFDPEQLSEFLSLLPTSVTADLCKHLILPVAADCLRRMPLEKSSPVIAQLGIERATMLMRRMKSSMRVQLIRAMSPVFANMARLVLRYPEGTVGRIMNPQVFTVNEEMTTEEVLNAIRNADELPHNTIFVTDDTQHLKGRVDIRLLLKSPPTTLMNNLMQPAPEPIPARSSVRQVTRHKEMQVADFLPVVDHLGCFIGILERADIYKALDTREHQQNDEEIGGAALAVAELFWDACANILAPEFSRGKDQKNERDN